MKTKIYNSFKDRFGNEYNFNNYLDFAQFWFNQSYRNKINYFPENFKKLQNCATKSKEARTKVLSN